MPIDIFVEVCEYLLPLDLLRLARASKRLRGMLLSDHFKTVWKQAFLNVPSLPECPQDLPQPEYASLMFETGCQICGADTKRTLFTARVRYCNKCIKENFVGTYGAVGEGMWMAIGGVVNRIPGRISGNVLFPGKRRRSGDYYCLRTVAAEIAERSARVPYDHKNWCFRPAALEAFLGHLDREHEIMEATGAAMQKWKDEETEARELQAAQTSERRLAAIKSKLLDLEWQEVDIPDKTDSEWFKLACRPTDLTEAIWKRVYPKLVPLLEKQRTARLAKEAMARRNFREQEIRDFYQDYTRHRQMADPTLSGAMLPAISHIFGLPSVGQLLEEDTAAIDADMWAPLLYAIDRSVPVHQEYIKKSLRKALAIGLETSNEEDSTNSYPLLPQPLPEESELVLATTVYRCSTCNDGKLRWYPLLLEHYHFDTESGERLPFDVEAMQISSLGRQIVVRLLKELDLDAQTPVRALTSSRLYQCYGGHRRHAKPMSLGALVQHYYDEVVWYEHAQKARERPREIVYPDLVGDEPLPCLVDSHTLDSARPLCKEVMIKDGEWVEYQPPTVNCPAVFSHFDGSLDSDDEEETEELTCLLCPRGLSQKPLAPRKMCIHIQERHSRQPNLDKYARGPPSPVPTDDEGSEANEDLESVADV